MKTVRSFEQLCEGWEQSQCDKYAKIITKSNFDPNVTIVASAHPMVTLERRAIRMPQVTGGGKAAVLHQGKCIGEDCWFGESIMVCPREITGSSCVIGTGAIAPGIFQLTASLRGLRG